MPVSSATAERSFSSLKSLKTYLRTTMVEDRLNGLSLMHIHRGHQIEMDRIIQQFAADGNQRIRLFFHTESLYSLYQNLQKHGI